MPNADRDALMRHIRECPDDDAPRLVFADWLDEHGEADRAEFIRVQCALAADPYRPDRVPLCRREEALLHQNAERWVSEDNLAEWIDARYLAHRGLPHQTGRFHRGFVDVVVFRSPDECLSAIDRVAERTPLQGVELGQPYPALPLPNPLIDISNRRYHIRSRERNRARSGEPPTPGPQDVPEFPEPDEFRRFVADPRCERLRSFRMDTQYVDRRHLAILFESPLVARLRHLDLSGNDILWGDEWEAIGDAPTLSGLWSLALSGCNLEQEGLAALSASPHWHNLRTLTVETGNRQYSGSPILHTVVAANMPRLQELEVRGQQSGEDGLTALADWPGLARMRRLGLAWNCGMDRAGDHRVGLRRLLASPYWREVCEIDLSDTVSRVDHLAEVLQVPNLSTLRVLRLCSPFSEEQGPPLQDEAARMLAACPHLGEGVEVHFGRDRLTPVGERALRDRFGDGMVWYKEGRRAEL